MPRFLRDSWKGVNRSGRPTAIGSESRTALGVARAHKARAFSWRFADGPREGAERCRTARRIAGNEGGRQALPPLQRSAERFQGHVGLFDQTAERARLDWLVHRHNHGPASLPQNGVRPSLPALLKAKPPEGFDRLRPVHISRNLHATAKTGSWTKWRRTRAGAFPSSKYPPTASETMFCSSASVSPWVVMPPPAGSSQRATKPPVSAQGSTANVISTA